MLSAKRKSDGEIVTAYMESKSNAPFLCLECNEEVTLKTGRTRFGRGANAVRPRSSREMAIGKGVTGTAEAETAERRQRYSPVETLSRRERTANGIRGYNSVDATESVPPNSMYRPNLTIVN